MFHNPEREESDECESLVSVIWNSNSPAAASFAALEEGVRSVPFGSEAAQCQVVTVPPLTRHSYSPPGWRVEG